MDERYFMPATPRQRRYIAQLCMKLGIKEHLEDKPGTLGEAGRLISELKGRVRGLAAEKKEAAMNEPMTHGEERLWNAITKQYDPDALTIIMGKKLNTQRVKPDQCDYACGLKNWLVEQIADEKKAEKDYSDNAYVMAGEGLNFFASTLMDIAGDENRHKLYLETILEVITEGFQCK